MFKEIQAGLSKFFTRDKVFIFIALIILAYALFSYSDSKYLVLDRMDTGSQQGPMPPSAVPQQPAAPVPPQSPPQTAPQQSGYALKPVANPSDLLPTDSNSQWAALNPVSMNQGSIVMPDLLQAGYHIGLDTIGQSLRNANYQLRSDPIIAKADVGPWHQSTIEPDLGRVPLEVGAGCR
jgi:hypothetical protein